MWNTTNILLPPPNVGSKAAAYTAVALSLLTWRIWWAASNASNFKVYYLLTGDRGSTVVKVLCNKSESSWFDPRWCHWKFSLTQTFRPHYCPVVDSTSNRNEYRSISWGKCGRYVRLTTLPPFCTVVMKYGNLNFLELSGPLQACNGIALLFSDLHLATLTAVSFYCLHKVSTLHQSWKAHCVMSVL